MDATKLNDYGALLLRVSVGVVLIAHSLYLKLVVFTLPGTAQFFESIGLWGWLAYAVFIIEGITGVMMVLGYQVRVAALVVIPVLIGATWAHIGNGWLFTAEGGGWEYPLFLTATAGCVALFGEGAHALDSNRALGNARVLRNNAS
ncbi:MAG: DoxX family protein [Halomonadaceae bacterium]|nr:MAG: DoxX family protein [Halomonadaceae bacterium]